MNTTLEQTAPPELVRLRRRIEALPKELRDELEPMADQAIEDAIYRGRVLGLAKEAIAQFRLDVAAMKFDLEATRRERDALKRWV
ncbi:MAG: hypothetical protein SFX72_03985 [Isosphaeraceae bacterium]|nr:hypothetical protein [Isosphaeraceae bacterium]